MVCQKLLTSKPIGLEQKRIISSGKYSDTKTIKIAEKSLKALKNSNIAVLSS